MVKGCQPQLSSLVKSLRGENVAGFIGDDLRKHFWRGIWIHLNLGAGNAIFARRKGRRNFLEGPKILT